MKRSWAEARRRRLADFLRQLREERGIKQIELAERLGEPQSLVSKLESGERRVEFVRLEAVCVALDLPLEEFVRRWRAHVEEESV